jgi:predicted RNA-binding protein YlxR (DUF448 family)
MSEPKRHIAERTCVACHQTKPKRELVRLVRTPVGDIEIDLRGKKRGRGAYLCKTRECWDRALERRRRDPLAHSLKIEITPANRLALLDHVKALPPNVVTGERGVE